MLIALLGELLSVAREAVWQSSIAEVGVAGGIVWNTFTN